MIWVGEEVQMKIYWQEWEFFSIFFYWKYNKASCTSKLINDTIPFIQRGRMLDVILEAATEFAQSLWWIILYKATWVLIEGNFQWKTMQYRIDILNSNINCSFFLMLTYFLYLSRDIFGLSTKRLNLSPERVLWRAGIL